ncbi:2-succinyl-6-hydroxy-2,4-cyclohexadiene-1-carboxylate synthase [Sporosarcina gallistercoris]|uniref:Putative 2-succinyl-6-hydroxy-2,4-cyclohexadiene-1-carboxylate synthase n=1 Tax=Sporosarcina gallistercoris TaxID=2762245 RepID=A0ABR8PHW3_9BACL|nr:2-succinyl-6-hydroxy-2,4-cyclohexadiene-1-carboxylate synthase [Sporosarcina gallistercoris]MBD7907754.1 2-succinyl-6-hydroxy-2,4-cyclohexadiene-1-carboxylate synthase [Sporosarcina gallistercoris]
MDSDWITVNGHVMHVQRSGDASLPVVVFLHGFTGSTATWHTIISLLEGEIHAVAIDLWGHGRSDRPVNSSDYSMERQTADLEQLFSQLELTQFTLVGYSMGGRTALGYAVSYPNRIQRLVLESASPGLKTDSERANRKERDAQLANRLLCEPFEDFVDFWENLSLFDSQKSLSAGQKEAVRKERLNQDPQGLANSLIGIGTGSQPSYWRLLTEQMYPVILITGSLDSKFETIALEMKNLLPAVRHFSVKDAGHAIHVEKPQEFATIIDEIVKQN